MNLYIYACITFFTLFLVILTFPFRFYLKMDGYILRLYLYKFKVLELNLKNELEAATSNIKQAFLENEVTQEFLLKILKAYVSPLVIIKRVKIKYIKVLYYGYKSEYVSSSLMYGLTQAVVSNVGFLLNLNDIPFYYNFKYSDETKFKFSSMIYFTLGTLIEEMWRIRRKKV